MSSALTVRENRELERQAKLTRLAEVAKRAHEGVVEAAREAVLRALEAGRALLEAKEICRKGTWTAWLTSHFERSTSSAYDYMRIALFVAKNGNDPGCIAGLSYREAVRMLNGRAKAQRGMAMAEPAAAPLRRQNLPAPTVLTLDQIQAPPAAPVDEITTTEIPPANTADPLAPAMQHLEQTLDALRAVVGTNAGVADYATHVLLLLERIHIGMPSRTWFWD